MHLVFLLLLFLCMGTCMYYLHDSLSLLHYTSWAYDFCVYILFYLFSLYLLPSLCVTSCLLFFSTPCLPSTSPFSSPIHTSLLFSHAHLPSLILYVQDYLKSLHDRYEEWLGNEKHHGWHGNAPILVGTCREIPVFVSNLFFFCF